MQPSSSRPSPLFPAPCRSKLQLDARLRDALAGRTSLFSEAGAGAGGAGLAASLQRPLLCLFDRNFELSVVLQHAWTYKPLVRECTAPCCAMLCHAVLHRAVHCCLLSRITSHRTPWHWTTHPESHRHAAISHPPPTAMMPWQCN